MVTSAALLTAIVVNGVDMPGIRVTISDRHQ
jgi:hypothetical protein